MSLTLRSMGVVFSIISTADWKKVPLSGYQKIPQVIEISELDFNADVINSTSYQNLRRKVGVPSRFDSAGIHFIKVNSTTSQFAEDLWDEMAYDSQIRDKKIWLRIDIPLKAIGIFIPIRPIPTDANNISVNSKIISTLRFTIAGDVRKVDVHPIVYERARDRQKIYTAIFSSNYFDKDKSPPLWMWNIGADANVAEETALKIDSEDVVDNDKDPSQRYIGTFPMYDLENKTYTLEFELFKEQSYWRPRVYFANGFFIDSKTGGNMNGNRCSANMYHLGFQIQNNKTTGKMEYQFVDNGSDDYSTNLIQPNNTIWEVDENGERSAKLKVVLKGGAKKENVTIYEENGTIPTENVKTWTGDIIPIYFTIYRDDIKAAEGLIYQPADVPLVFGTGSYEKPTESQYYGLRDLDIYRGDTVNSDISFTINGTEYTVPDGTVWETFIDNNPNLDLSYKSYDDGAEVYCRGSLLDIADGVAVKKYETIEDGADYNIRLYTLRIRQRDTSDFNTLAEDDYDDRRLFIGGYEQTLPKEYESGFGGMDIRVEYGTPIEVNVRSQHPDDNRYDDWVGHITYGGNTYANESVYGKFTMPASDVEIVLTYDTEGALMLKNAKVRWFAEIYGTVDNYQTGDKQW